MTVKTRDVRPLAEGMTRKGGRNEAPSQVTERSAPPAPIMAGTITGLPQEDAPPRDVIGGNNPPHDIVADIENRLPLAYGTLEAELKAALLAARALPAVITNEEERAAVAKSQVEIRRIRAAIKRGRVAEKAPFLNAGRVVDGFFNAMDERGAKADAVLQDRSNVWVRHLSELERQRREREAEEAQRRADQVRAEAEAARLKAEAAERARVEAEEKAEKSRRQSVHDAAEKRARDEEIARMAAEELQRQADAAERELQRAETATAAKTADLVRGRSAGVVMTGRMEWKVEVDDFSVVNLDVIRPYLPRAEIEKAVKTWAKLNGYKGLEMPGVRIYEQEVARNRW